MLTICFQSVRYESSRRASSSVNVLMRHFWRSLYDSAGNYSFRARCVSDTHGPYFIRQTIEDFSPQMFHLLPFCCEETLPKFIVATFHRFVPSLLTSLLTGRYLYGTHNHKQGNRYPSPTPISENITPVVLKTILVRCVGVWKMNATPKILWCPYH